MEDTIIFTTGAYLTPKQVDGVWYWVVAEFDGDTFKDGESINNRPVSSDKLDILVNTQEL